MARDISKEIEEIKDQIRETEVYLDKIRGCFIGGAVGDALGYPVEFLTEDQIISKFGNKGITEYELDSQSGKALISDDTQMTLFTANGLLVGDTRGALRGIQTWPRHYVIRSYFDWLKTQNISYKECKNNPGKGRNMTSSWLMDIPELFSRRAPGNTCLSALHSRQTDDLDGDSYILATLNDSKGCGGIMRVAPLALAYHDMEMETLDMEGAEIAAITHSHSLGYMPAAVLVHIINRIVFAEVKYDLKDIVIEAKNTFAKLFSGDKHLKELADIIDLAIDLSENDLSDRDNIHRIGEGWVAEETLGIAVYCALRYQNSFSDGVIAAVNHNGDSDSTGAVTGNILGALLGYDAIDEKWKANLELIDVITEMADDICHGCQMTEYGAYRDLDWERKYIYMHWHDENVKPAGEVRMSTHSERIKVFEDTQSWIKSDPDLSAAVDAAKRNTTIYYEDDYPIFDASKIRNMKITVSGDRSYQAAMRLHKENPGAKIAVMNFANAFHAGGGVTQGAGAQEECLCRTSTLYPLLYRRTLRDSFYKHHNDLNTSKASDSLVYTEGVVICKTDTDLPERMPKEDWVSVDVITIAAPDLRTKSNQYAELVGNGTYMNDAELFGYHVKRAIHMLTCAAAKGADILVLGAFGCGAFQNDPKVVARAYKTALEEFPKVFDQIEFAILLPPTGSVNYDVFKSVFDE